MADYTAGPDTGDEAIPASTYVNVLAAAVSLALVCGVAVWGYKLLVRDVTGVPVVRALAGEMRVAPENPGGEIAAHVGLSVNDVPAIGGAAEPEDRLILAPNSTSLMIEDIDVVPAPAEGTETIVSDTTDMADWAAPLTPLDAAMAVDDMTGDEVDPAAPMTVEDVLALADRVALGAAATASLSAEAGDPLALSDEAVSDGALDETDATAAVLAAMPGVQLSPRPTSRPANLARPVAVTPPAALQTAPTPAPVVTSVVPTGTKLVQLGAFDSPEVAAGEWVRLTTRFPEFFDGKTEVIQQADSGGRTFFRLRALGFSELEEARRFCSALSAEGAACIPVVMR